MTFGEPLNWLERLQIRAQPTAMEVASLELKDAQLQALQMEGKAEYYELRKQISILTAEYHQGRIQRLRHFLGLDVNPCAEIDFNPK